MSDLIRREDAMQVAFLYPFFSNALMEEIKAIPSADRPQGDSVSRQYLLAEIDDLADEFSEVDENGLHSERWCGIIDAKCVIANAPLVADRPQGEWIEIGTISHSYKCSVCGRTLFNITVGKNHVAKYYPYCHCGARMKGAGDEF